MKGSYELLLYGESVAKVYSRSLFGKWETLVSYHSPSRALLSGYTTQFEAVQDRSAAYLRLDRTVNLFEPLRTAVNLRPWNRFYHTPAPARFIKIRNDVHAVSLSVMYLNDKDFKPRVATAELKAGLYQALTRKVMDHTSVVYKLRNLRGKEGPLKRRLNQAIK